MMRRLLTCVCIFVCALGSATVAALEGTGDGTFEEKITFKGCETSLVSGSVTGFSIGTLGNWSMSTPDDELTGVYTIKKTKLNLELDSPSHDSLAAYVAAAANQSCGYPPGTLAVTDVTIKKFAAKLARDRATLSLKLKMTATLTDGEITYKSKYQLLAEIAFTPTGGGIGGKIEGQVLAPDGKIAASEPRDLLASVSGYFLSPAQSSIAGLLPVPNGTPVELVHLSATGTVDGVLASTTVSKNGKYAFDLDKLGHFDAPDLAVRVSDRGVQMRAFLTAPTVDISPVSEAVFQLVTDRIMAVAGTLLANFTFDELDDLAAGLDLITSLNPPPAVPGIDALVAAIKDLATQDPGISDFLVAATDAGQTDVGIGDIGNLFSITQGNRWEYVSTSSDYDQSWTELIKVNGTMDINGTNVVVMNNSSTRAFEYPFDEYRVKDSHGLYNWGNTDPEDYLTPPIVPYQEAAFPLRSGSTLGIIDLAGLVWPEDLDYDGMHERFDVTAKLTTSGIEGVSVPAGNFPLAMKQEITIEIDVTLSHSGKHVIATDTITQWLASDVGVVKQDATITTSAFGKTDTTWYVDELSAYWVDGQGGGMFSDAIDLSFGDSGIVIHEDPDASAEARTMAIQQDDGKILVGGRVYNTSNYREDVIVERYSEDGVLDSGFGVNGTFTYDSGNAEEAYDLVVQPDGKILVAGYIDQFNAGNDNFLVMRLEPDGTLDTGFGDNGIAAVNTSVYGDNATAIALQPDGKIIVAGNTNNGSIEYIAVLRLTADGTLDGSFGNAGVFLYSRPDGGWCDAYGVAVQPDGRILVTGSASEASTAVAYRDVLTMRLDVNGSLDTSYGTGGVTLFGSNYSNENYEIGRAVAVLPDGDILVNASILLIRQNSDGTLDTQFGDNGVAPYQEMAQSYELYTTQMALTADRKIVVAGRSATGAAVVVLTEDGNLDTGFATNGVSTVSLPVDRYVDVALTADGKIMGTATSNDNIAIVRLVSP